jgi:ABC-type transport system involved in multi-copper enzyme maturation permease subunit
MENLPAVLKSIAALVTYIVLFVTTSVVIFKRKDILS